MAAGQQPRAARRLRGRGDVTTIDSTSPRGGAICRRRRVIIERFEGASRPGVAFGCFLRRRGRRVGAEECQRGWEVTSSSSSRSSSKKRQSLFRIGDSFRPILSSVKSSLIGNLSPVFGVIVSQV